MLGLISGAVTPLGLLNDREHTVPFWLGKSFLKCSRLMVPSRIMRKNVCRLRLNEVSRQ